MLIVNIILKIIIIKNASISIFLYNNRQTYIKKIKNINSN